MKRAMALLFTLIMVLTSMAGVAAQSLTPADPIEGCAYSDETGHNLCEPFLGFWNANGGLPIFGYPLTEAFDETSVDTGNLYRVQYFERERLEDHPALAGTDYEVQLGRLGNEVLLAQGRDWREFPRSSPSEANYFEVTGFAVPQVFMNYWRSHGLELGDAGISYRESLALFGYPISPAQEETNQAGDTVLTQWFERARFEYHPDNTVKYQVLLGLLGTELLEANNTPVEYMLTPVTNQVSQPRHLSVGPDGATYVANAGMAGEECHDLSGVSVCHGLSGSITRIDDGGAETFIAGLPSVAINGEISGIHDVFVTDAGKVYGVIGWGFGLQTMHRDALGEAGKFFGQLVEIKADGSLVAIADLLQHESDNDPDGNGIDANPYALAMDGDTFLVADAGANTLLSIAPNGEITTIIALPIREGQNPFAPPGVLIPVESVPTTVVIGPDGAYYVGELTGGPFPLGHAVVWRITQDGQISQYATGFTNISAIDFDSKGNLYVMEMVAGGLAMVDPENPVSASGALTKVSPDGSRELIAGAAQALMFSTGLVVDYEDMIYINNLAVMPGASHIARVDVAP